MFKVLLKLVQILDIPKWPKGLNYLTILHSLLQKVQRMQDQSERSCCLALSGGKKNVSSMCVSVCVFHAFALMLTRGLMHAERWDMTGWDVNDWCTLSVIS